MSFIPAVAAPAEHVVYRKIAWRLIPFLLLCYMLATIDRFNIGFAKLQFLHDLKLDDAAYGIAAGVFSIGYVAFEVPSNLLLERVGVRRTLLRIMALWGMVTCLLMFAQSALHLYILRFLLGVAEAGFFPGILLYLTYWFPDRLRGRMTSLFVMAVPVGGIISGPLSGWVMAQFQGVAGYHGWQWLFLTEGAPAVLCGVVAYFYLSDNAAKAPWLSDEEKNWVLADLAADRQSRPQQKGSFRDALRDPKVYLLAFIYFAYFCSLNTILLWAPTVLKAVSGQTVSSIGWISGAISLVSTIGMVVVGYSSDKYLERRWHVALCGFAAAACFFLLPLAVGSLALTVTLLTIASIGIFSVLSLFWTIPSAYLNQSAAAGGLALISSIGSFGGAVSPAMIGAVKVHTGSLYVGLDVVAGLLAIGMLAVLVCIPAAKRAVVKIPEPVNSPGRVDVV
jgi:D-galactonate transporter